MLGKVVAGRYRLEARLGEGGMGVVYRARHVLIDRVVALKLIRPDLRGETHLRAWMLREARAANRVDHAHIIDIHDIGETEDGELYLVMEYLVGTRSRPSSRKGPMPLARARRHPRADVRRARARSRPRRRAPRSEERQHPAHRRAAAAKTSSRSSTSDWRRSRAIRGSRPKGAVFGTPEYMSPEQARGEEAGRRSPISTRSASCSSRCSPGSCPSAPTTATRCSRCSARAAAASRARSRPDANPQAEAIVLRLLEKDVRKRFQDAHHLQEELKALQRSLPSQPWDVQAIRRARRGAARRRPRRRSPGVIEWASRAALFSRMVCARLSRRATRRPRCSGRRQGLGARRARQRASKARSRATRASSRRSSAAAARSAPKSAERSKSWRTKSRACCAKAPPSRKRPRRSAASSWRPSEPRGGKRAQADAAERNGQMSRAVFEKRRRRRRDHPGQARVAAQPRGQAGGARGHRARSAPPDRRAPRAACPLRRGARRGSGVAAARRSPRARARGSRSRRPSAR